MEPRKTSVVVIRRSKRVRRVSKPGFIPGMPDIDTDWDDFEDEIEFEELMFL